MNIIEKINNDRQVARTHDDSNADLCFLALSEDGRPSVRTLVLREVSEAGLTLFINSTSPKWRSIQKNDQGELVLWLPSIQRQYRVYGHISPLPRSAIEKNWPRRPAGSKFLDLSYGEFADQSSPIEDRRQLQDHVAHLRDTLDESTLSTPETATGVILAPESIESLDLNRADRLHERKLYERTDGGWIESQLMP